MPEFVGKSPYNVICSFIAGVLDGDGCISKTNTVNRIITVSSEFAYQMCSLLNSIGISCGVQKNKNMSFSRTSGKRVENKEFPILHCTFSSIPYEIFSKMSHPVRKERASLKVNRLRKSRRIKSIKREDYSGYYYDFTISSDSHTYIANGHFISNTHVTGIITANNNDLGVVGVAPKAKVVCIKVLGDNGSGAYKWISRGIEEAIARNVDIISMSLGGPFDESGLHAAIKRAYENNIPIICAAGNAGDVHNLDYPGRYTETISIGALNADNIRAEFSQTGRNLDFMAPGVDILSTVPVNSYSVMSGSSMSCPWAAGVVALMLSKHHKKGGSTPVNTVEDVREHLKKTAIDLQDAGRDPKTGFGLIDVGHSVGLMKTADNIPDHI